MQMIYLVRFRTLQTESALIREHWNGLGGSINYSHVD